MLALFFLTQLQGCTFDENLHYYDLRGTVKLPIEASSFLYKQGDETREIDDIRAIGPVYIGVYPAVEEGLYPYPHPEMGPILTEGQDGNAYPYGGNTVGRFDWACYEQLSCKVTTGRFEDYDALLDFFGNVLEDPIRTMDGQLVGSSQEYAERCYEIRYSTGDDEMLFIGAQDFRVEGDYLVADVVIPHIPYYEGMQIWGWVDMPSVSFEFNTCDVSVGENINYYAENYTVGTNVIDALNYPGKYIDFGDWVVQTPVTVTDPTQKFELEIGFHYQEE